ncbi:hypothetical protein N7449_009973 [Penicillium cf. viridicatum]|uniref:Uncharacterized protein n=1 Tax=Penicillium cf. viridicatum TaxID=2972119 RepID=A0A9W9IZK7_9EURO|nr:hypothetical protein N7449_009973 [Penicillium cf. viridicatum]
MQEPKRLLYSHTSPVPASLSSNIAGIDRECRFAASNRFAIPFARVPMRNAPPGTRCAHEDGRKGCESMRFGSGQGLSTEVRTHPNEKSIREVRPRLQEKMENQTVWHRTTPPVPI